MADKKESKIVLERTYTVPLRKAFVNTPKYKRTRKAVCALRIFLEKHMKATEVKIGQHVNEYLWQDGIRNPPPRVTIHAIKDDEGVVRVELEGKTFKESVRALAKEEEPTSALEKVKSALGTKKSDEKAEEPAKGPVPQAESKPSDENAPEQPAEKPKKAAPKVAKKE
jgi:large subunit ribosomal protein L31e